MLEEILQLNRRAAANGDFEVAYHLLMAALHAADRAGDEDALQRLGELAREQGKAVEAVRPTHHLSRRQALSRGQTSVFDSFTAHLDAVRLRLQSQRQLKR
jgi:histidinol phosphatase-like PHP family hydrolase